MTKDRFKLWHIASEMPERDTWVLFFYHHKNYGVRYGVEYVPHIENWMHYIEYHQVVGWCDICDLHGFGVSVGSVAQSIIDELADSIRECQCMKGRYGGVNFYYAYRDRTAYLRFLIKLTRRFIMDNEKKMTLKNLLPEVAALKAKVQGRRDFVGAQFEAAGEWRSDSKEIMARMEMLDAALENIDELEENLNDIEGV